MNVSSYSWTTKKETRKRGLTDGTEITRVMTTTTTTTTTRTTTMIMVMATILMLASVADAAFCNGSPSPDAKPNMNEIITVEGVGQHVKSVTNGSLYHVGNGDDRISVVHLWGGAYSRGFAMGTLMKDDAATFYKRAYAFFEEQFVSAINGTVPWIPEWAAEWVADVGLGIALDLTYDATKKYSGQYFFDEMRGIADATGTDYKMIRRIHMIGELTKGSCSMYGAWDKATAGGKTLQMRALDWDTSGPFQDYPQITVYHASSSDAQDNSFVNVGWTGWVGSITGMSSSGTAISEIGVSFPDATFGKESRFGVPFTFLLRDLLQFETTLSGGIEHIKDAHRTCDLILGFGDGKVSDGEAPFRGIQYSASVANFYDDTDMMPRNDSWHARMSQVVYYGMDWLCPKYSEVLHTQLEQLHGQLTPENSISHVMPIVQTGDLHIAVYDLTERFMFVANARGANEEGPEMAYDRQFVKLNMTALFALESKFNLI